MAKAEAFRFFNNLLSRCDTIHDFTGERARKATEVPFYPDAVYKILRGVPNLSECDLKNQYNNIYGATMDRALTNDFTSILKRNESLNFSFVKASEDYIGVSRTAGYEPAVVVWFEHMLAAENIMDPVYMLSFDTIRAHNFVDYTKPIHKHFEPKGKVSIFNLGNSQKLESNRRASGIWSDVALYNRFQDDLKQCFCKDPKNTKLMFVIDASSINNETFDNSDKGMSVVSVASTLWDSASKYAKAASIDTTYETDSNAINSVLFVLDSIALTKTNQALSASMNKSDMFHPEDVPREVPHIVHCIQQQQPFACTPRLSGFQLREGQTYAGALFDIKRSGDGCQVLEIKALNEEMQRDGKLIRFVLVTLDHLAFLKARMNGVPVVFTQKHTKTNSRRLVCVNNEDALSPLEKLELLVNTAEAEQATLTDNQGLFSETEGIVVYERLEHILDVLRAVRGLIEEIYFGRGKVQDGDAYFNQIVLNAITPPSMPQVSTSDLNAVQKQDLGYISMRIKAYLFDFLCVEIDVYTRFLMLDDMQKVYVALFDSLERAKKIGLAEKEQHREYEYPKNTKRRMIGGAKRIRDTYALEKAIDRLQTVLSGCAVVKQKLYGRSLYDWTLDKKQTYENVLTYLDDVKNNLVGILRDSSDNGKTALGLIEFCVKQHFLLEKHPPEVQEVLNFRPIKVYEQIWGFLKKSFNSISMSTIAPRTTRGTSNGSSPANMFYDKAQQFIHKVYIKKKQTLPASTNTEWDHLLEEVLDYDAFFRDLLMEENTQNFTFRLCNAGFVAEWLAVHNITATIQVGSGNTIESDGNISDDSDESETIPLTYAREKSPAMITSYESDGESNEHVSYNSYSPPPLDMPAQNSSSISSVAADYKDVSDHLLYDAFRSRFHDLPDSCYLHYDNFMRMHQTLEECLQQGNIIQWNDLYDILEGAGLIDTPLPPPNTCSYMTGGGTSQTSRIARIIAHIRRLVSYNMLTWPGAVMLITQSTVHRHATRDDARSVDTVLMHLRAMDETQLAQLEDRLVGKNETP